MKILGRAILIVFAIIAYGVYNGGGGGAGDDRPSRQSVSAASPQESSSPPPYSDKIAPALAQLTEFKASDFTSEARMIALAFGLFNEWAKVADEAPSSLSEADTAKRKQFLATLSSKQRQAFPALRDAYGPAMRKALWEADGKAKTFGKGYRTVEFISGAFAANRNIKSFHEDLHQTLMQMRFTRAQYKWLDADVEYSYYMLSPPDDSEVVVWNKSSFRAVK